MKILDIEIVSEGMSRAEVLELATMATENVYGDQYKRCILEKDEHIHVQVMNISDKDAEGGLMLNKGQIPELELFREKKKVKFVATVYDVPDAIPN